MKQTITLPLYAIYSIIQDIEKMAKNPETAKQYENLHSAMNLLKEAFMPLIDEYRDCLVMPDIDAIVDTNDMDSENDRDNGIDWEQRKYELTKAAMQGKVSALDKNFNIDAMIPSIVNDSIKMADKVIDVLRKDKK